MSVKITERDRLALLGGIEVIRLYQRTIADTTKLMASILDIAPDPDYTARNYYGLLSDEIDDDQRTAQAALSTIITHYEVTVEEDAPAGLGHE